ncbi:MAG TPA: DUF3068 domain-containing protein [Candidatus Corynebacterium gallistercoris]|uniref:DUF3068 domain-containing protein n=1 Tax=Candidatus Corynebacterium gallistercoris TaxID=2838530 RepID=A0A9D1RX71_9CORY|nr:DUF3068 domain-containing protein [Candidatus Corynebacterium gallistercoris]
MRKILSYTAVLLGAALLVFAIALPTYVVPKGKVLPLDVVSTTKTDVIEGNLLDSGALASGKPVQGKESRPECQGDHPQISCFMWKGIELQSQRFTTGQEPANDEVVTLEAGQTLFRKDKEEPKNLLSASVDRVTLDRKTQMPVPDPVSTIHINAPAQSGAGEIDASVAPFTRPGITYQFPMGTDRKSYDYFDMQVMKTQPIDYVGEEDFDGTKVYRFEQTVPPTELYSAVRERLEQDGDLSKADEGTLAAYRLKFPAKVWGVSEEDIKSDNPANSEPPLDETEAEEAVEEAAEGEDDLGPDVEMNRYYTVNRTIWVEPDTGVIVNGREEVFQFYAQDQAEADSIAENRDEEVNNPTRTATFFPGEWDDESRARQMDKALEGKNSMELMGTTLPWILGIVGVLLLVVGFVLARGSRRSH